MSETEKYDAVIIGAGIIGCAVALELSRMGHKTINVEMLPAAGYDRLRIPVQSFVFIIQQNTIRLLPSTAIFTGRIGPVISITPTKENLQYSRKPDAWL